eukprot:2192561-Rhodomonas_salina.3
MCLCHYHSDYAPTSNLSGLSAAKWGDGKPGGDGTSGGREKGELGQKGIGPEGVPRPRICTKVYCAKPSTNWYCITRQHTVRSQYKDRDIRYPNGAT